MRSNNSGSASASKSWQMAPLNYENAGVKAQIVSKLKHEAGKFTLETDCEFKKENVTEKITTSVSASGSLERKYSYN